MKKFLAIVLSIMMVLGVCSVGVFAFNEEDLPAIPAQTDNYIYFVAGHARATANQTYDIPVYMVSKYPTAIQDGYVELGFTFYLSDNAYATVNDVTFADGIKAVNGFVPLEAHYGYTEDEMSGVATWHGDLATGYVAFAAGLEALNQVQVQVCTINVTTTDVFPDGENYVDGSADSVQICFGAYDFINGWFGNYFDGAGGIFEGAIPQDLGENAFEVDPDEFIEIGTAQSEKGIYFSYGFLYKYVAPPVPSWSDKLIDWFKEQVEQIFQICDTIREYIRAILAVI